MTGRAGSVWWLEAEIHIGSGGSISGEYEQNMVTNDESRSTGVSAGYGANFSAGTLMVDCGRNSGYLFRWEYLPALLPDPPQEQPVGQVPSDPVLIRLR